MKVEIKVDDYFAEKMFDKHCQKSECINCNCEVKLNENYTGCFPKYLEVQFNNDIQNIFDRIVDLIQ